MASTSPELVVEHGTRFLGTAEPRLTWRAPADLADWTQAGAEVAVDRGRGWEVHRLDGPESVLVAWPFAPLVSREQVAVRVRVAGTDGRQTAWSDEVQLEAALLLPGDWVARMVAPDLPEDPDGLHPPPLLRRSFDVGPEPVSARLHVTAHGLYSAWVSGSRVSDHLFAPVGAPTASACATRPTT